MAALQDSLSNLGYLDRLAYGDTPIHRLDPRTKVIATAAFVFTVVSFPKYAVSGLIPFFLFPVVMLTLGEIPPGFLARRILFVSPFAVFVGIFNPLLDSAAVMTPWGVPIRAGWLSFCSIMIKFTLTISSALLLIATTSLPGVCQALRRFGLPASFTTQLLFLYRYLFVLMEEALRIVRAREVRTFGKRGAGMQIAARMIGILFIRTVERSERVYSAMLSRGFRGEIPSLRSYRFTRADLVFLTGILPLLYAFRTFDIVALLGGLLSGGR